MNQVNSTSAEGRRMTPYELGRLLTSSAPASIPAWAFADSLRCDCAEHGDGRLHCAHCRLHRHKLPTRLYPFRASSLFIQLPADCSGAQAGLVKFCSLLALSSPA